MLALCRRHCSIFYISVPLFSLSLIGFFDDRISSVQRPMRMHMGGPICWVLGPLHCTYGFHHRLTSYNGSTSWRRITIRRVRRNETETSGAISVITKPPIGGWSACSGGRRAPHGSQPSWAQALRSFRASRRKYYLTSQTLIGTGPPQTNPLVPY